ncbi:hypothetical protein RND81_01G048500 [Saponaria officinalis]|uniref:PRISE-like Rossmann-fold domain-containing protein n=1 Tax=Saponaria officinalis TaxID=3572 RepID=A0AAW1N5R7_SAPOF
MALKKSNKNHKRASTKRVAAIFGVTGLVGRELARLLSSKYSWKMYGIARRGEQQSSLDEKDENYHFISCDLFDPLETRQKLSSLEDVTHIYWVTWASQYPLDSLECCEQNRAMLSNVLDTILPKAQSLKHVSLQTGMKHYVSLCGPVKMNDFSLYDEGCPRASDGNNFYYVQEDLLRERLSEYNIAWSVQRPGLITGCSNKTLYNFMGCLCIYASICKELDLPFMFGGSKECWEETYIDVSDARLVAEQHIWASTDDQISSNEGEAFNAINGVSFTWKEAWPLIGKKFGLEVPEKMFSAEFSYSRTMADKAGVWSEIVKKKGLVETKMDDLANWVFLDMLFRCPLKLSGTRAKADSLGFKKRYTALQSISYWINQMREEKLIP